MTFDSSKNKPGTYPSKPTTTLYAPLPDREDEPTYTLLEDSGPNGQWTFLICTCGRKFPRTDNFFECSRCGRNYAWTVPGHDANFVVR